MKLKEIVVVYECMVSVEIVWRVGANSKRGCNRFETLSAGIKRMHCFACVCVCVCVRACFHGCTKRGISKKVKGEW